MKTKIINNTSHVIVIKDGNGFAYLDVTNVRPLGEYTIDFFGSQSYREYLMVMAKDGRHLRTVISSDDMADNFEITLYETCDSKLGFRGAPRLRDLTFKREGSSEESIAFVAVCKDASSRLEMIETSCASVKKRHKQVRICPAQCQRLVQTCLDGTMAFKAIYAAKSKADLWKLYSSKKLGQFISSVDKLLSTLGSIQDLLRACGRKWCSMGLVMSLPLPPPERTTYSKFDLLMKELNWNLETIHHALHLEKELDFKWDARKSRFVLESAGVPFSEDMNMDESQRLVSEDRVHLLLQLESGSILAPDNIILHLVSYLGFKFSAGRSRDELAVDLKKRLQETSILSNDCSSVPESCWINHMDLKLLVRLSGEFSLKSVWKGEWRGQAVAVGVTINTPRVAFERAAVFMLKMRHPNIVGFLGCAFTDDAPPPVRQRNDDKCTAGYIVMELLQEDLWHVIDRCAKSHFGSPFTVAVAVDILVQIVAAMVHMHKCGIMHRDLKAANCVVNPRSSSSTSLPVLNLHTLKLIDFELSKELDPDAPISNHTANSGTRRWMAPEVWGIQISEPSSSERQMVPYERSADVWSFGMTCYEVITGLLPFHECFSNTDLVVALREGKRPVLPGTVSCPEGLKELMSKCWAQEPGDRPHFEDIEKALWTIKYQLEVL